MAFRPLACGLNFQEHKARLVALARVQQSWIDECPTYDPKPEHVLYPDKYRPSGIGDNTGKKRKWNALPPIDGTTKQELVFNPTPSLMQKYGTREDPIKLEDSDDDDDEDTAQRVHAASPRTPANSKVKRVKVRDTRGPDQQIEAELNYVRGVLRDFGREVRQGQERMRMVFDEHSDRVVSGMAHMKALVEALKRANDDAKAVVESTENAMNWLAETGDEVF